MYSWNDTLNDDEQKWLNWTLISMNTLGNTVKIMETSQFIIST